MSFQRRPSSSLRRMPVMADSHRAGNSRCPAAARRNGLQLLGGPGLLLDLGDRPQPRCVGDEGDVAGDETAADGVAEGAADDEVHLVHRLGCQRPSTVAGVQHPVVEGLEVVWSQPAEAGRAEGGEDVALGLVHVAAVGAGGEGELLARQPLARQVGAEGERPDLVVASVAFRGEAGGEPFGLGPIGAGGVPGAAFPTGDGVEAFVDHCVVAVPLAADVAVHGALLRAAGSSRVRWNDR